ncbi:MAG: helix-turn-helix domain-containing protein [Prochlorotrichaceae cyanobacterium]
MTRPPQDTPPTYPLDPKLRAQMQVANLTSFRQLAQRSGLSRYQINKIRRGEWESLSFAGAVNLATVLNLSLAELLSWTPFEVVPPPSETNALGDDRQKIALDYQHLENQLQQQAANLRSQFQREVLQQLESWLLNWPKVVHAVQSNKPDLLAAKILPLLRPLDLLLQAWEVDPIGAIGDRLPYTPQEHRLLSSGGEITPGILVEIQRPGYRHQGHLLFRAEVSPVQDSGEIGATP